MTEQPTGDGNPQKKEALAEVFINGERGVAINHPPPLRPPRQPRAESPLDPSKLAGPKLKVKRAKSHISDLEAAINAFKASDPYSLSCEIDPQTGEDVCRMKVKEDVPIEFSAILGDIVHNLRAALDHVISDLIRANGREPDGGSGFPIVQRAKNLKPGRISKIEGVSATTERFILRLKPHETGNPALWNLHMLDVLDKHAGIIAVGAASAQVLATVAIPFLFQSPNGDITVGAPAPGGVPFGMRTGVPESFKPVFPLENDIEIYRAPRGLHQRVDAAISIAFGKGQVCEGEPVIETLKQYTDLVDRILGVFERRCL